MLATLIDEPFHKPGWVYEEKYDGYRLIAYKEDDRVTLFSRNDIDRTASFSEIAEAIGGLPVRTLILDGEAVVFDKSGVSRFQLVQQGGKRIGFAVFDCLYVDGLDLRKHPLTERRTALESVLHGETKVFASKRLAADGFAAYAAATKKGLEGLVAKDASSIYVERRSRHWLKCKVHQEEEFVIGGYTAPGGARSHFGALLLGAYDKAGLHFVGKVGTGFSQRTLLSLSNVFRSLTREKSPFIDAPRERDVTYLAPKLVAQIAFQEWTSDRKLRQPVFLGLRDDKKPTECLMPQ